MSRMLHPPPWPGTATARTDFFSAVDCTGGPPKTEGGSEDSCRVSFAGGSPATIRERLHVSNFAQSSMQNRVSLRIGTVGIDGGLDRAEYWIEGMMIMATQRQLPSRFPVGTHYIVEGEPRKGGQPRIVSRYVVMPSGVRYDLMTPADRVRKPADLARKAPKRRERGS
jgi:hypothetical protein